MDQKLLEILACPVCKGKLQFIGEQKLLVCLNDKLGYPVRNNVPILLPDEAVSYPVR